jgi:hypothetical protein
MNLAKIARIPPDLKSNIIKDDEKENLTKPLISARFRVLAAKMLAVMLAVSQRMETRPNGSPE